LPFDLTIDRHYLQYQEFLMECFAHQGKHAVGLCKVCARGVCRDCAIKAEHSLACSQEHAAFAEKLTEVQFASLGNAQLYRAQRYVQPLASLALIALGLGYLYAYDDDLFGWLFLGFGLLMGLTHFFPRRKKKS
jgi:hypothetical protein